MHFQKHKYGISDLACLLLIFFFFLKATSQMNPESGKASQKNAVGIESRRRALIQTVEIHLGSTWETLETYKKHKNKYNLVLPLSRVALEKYHNYKKVLRKIDKFKKDNKLDDFMKQFETLTQVSEYATNNGMVYLTLLSALKRVYFFCERELSSSITNARELEVPKLPTCSVATKKLREIVNNSKRNRPKSNTIEDQFLGLRFVNTFKNIVLINTYLEHFSRLSSKKEALKEKQIFFPEFLKPVADDPIGAKVLEEFKKFQTSATSRREAQYDDIPVAYQTDLRSDDTMIQAPATPLDRYSHTGLEWHQSSSAAPYATSSARNPYKVKQTESPVNPYSAAYGETQPLTSYASPQNSSYASHFGTAHQTPWPLPYPSTSHQPMHQRWSRVPSQTASFGNPHGTQQNQQTFNGTFPQIEGTYSSYLPTSPQTYPWSYSNETHQSLLPYTYSSSSHGGAHSSYLPTSPQTYPWGFSNETHQSQLPSADPSRLHEGTHQGRSSFFSDSAWADNVIPVDENPTAFNSPSGSRRGTSQTTMAVATENAPTHGATAVDENSMAFGLSSGSHMEATEAALPPFSQSFSMGNIEGRTSVDNTLHTGSANANEEIFPSKKRRKNS